MRLYAQRSITWLLLRNFGQIHCRSAARFPPALDALTLCGVYLSVCVWVGSAACHCHTTSLSTVKLTCERLVTALCSSHLLVASDKNPLSSHCLFSHGSALDALQAEPTNQALSIGSLICTQKRQSNSAALLVCRGIQCSDRRHVNTETNAKTERLKPNSVPLRRSPYTRTQTDSHTL